MVNIAVKVMRLHNTTFERGKNHGEAGQKSCAVVRLGVTFLAEMIMSRSTSAGSLFKHEERNIEFESREAQYCSSCTLESWTGTQYSTNLGEPDLHSDAMYCATLSFNREISVLESITILSLFNPLKPESRRESKLR